MQKTIFCFDMDGTLLDENGKIHPMDVAYLRRSEEINFIAATGRPLPSLKKIFARHGLFVDQKIPFPLVLQNGTLLYLPNEEKLAYMPFDAPSQKKIISLARQFPTISFLFFGETEMFMINRTEEGERSNRQFNLSTVLMQPSDESIPLCKVMAISNDRAALQAFEKVSMQIPAERCISIGTVFELNPPGVDKSTGLIKILQEMKISQPRILIAGDGGNDLPLFKIAGRTYAPDSAPEWVRSQADCIVDRSQNGMLDALVMDVEKAFVEN